MMGDEETKPMEINSSRLFNASPETLFNAFADPERLKHWWGPKGFTNTFGAFDFRPGGEWVFTMRGPDGTDYPNKKIFLEIHEHELISFQHPDPAHRFVMTMTFEAKGAQTLLTWRMEFEPHTDNAAIKDFIASSNEQNFDRLAAQLRPGDNRQGQYHAQNHRRRVPVTGWNHAGAGRPA
jgi:uncharacterized protein YndB with AHSA1/START domain